MKRLIQVLLLCLSQRKQFQLPGHAARRGQCRGDAPGPHLLTLDHSTLRTWTSWLLPMELLLTQPRGTVLVA